MINSPFETRALATADKWLRYLSDLREFSADVVPLETQGMLVRVTGLVLEAAGIRVPVGSVCEVRMDGLPPVAAEVVGFSDDRAYLMPTGDIHGLASGARVVPRPSPVLPMKLGAAQHPWRRSEDRTLHLPVGDGLLGRVLDSLGVPMDRKGPLTHVHNEPLIRRPINAMDRDPVRTPLDTGVRAINAMLTVGRGQRIGLFAGTGVGKSVLLGMMARYTEADVIVVGLIGERGREVKASVALFVEANGDLAFASIGQQHLHATVELMNALPKRYNHFMVAGQGGFAAALASVAIPDGECDEARKEREAKMGLHSGTRNKHLTWLKAIIEGAAVAGYTEHALNYRGLRHGSKQIKKRDKRKKHEKRPNWDLETWQRLTSGPVYEGCAGLDHRFKAGSVVFHDGVYFSPLIVLNICGRPSEGAGPEVGDVFDEAPIPYIYIRRNSLRGLKIDEGERKVPIHPRLIELGFLKYVRAVRAAGRVALFPEFVHPEGKLDFAWMMRDKAIDPAKALHFPNGTGLILYGKEPDGHSLRGTGRSALADGLPAVEEKMRNYISGHVSGRVGIDVYETPPPVEDVLRAIRKLDPWFAHLASKPLNLRPADRMKFGSPRGRPKEI